MAECCIFLCVPSEFFTSWHKTSRGGEMICDSNTFGDGEHKATEIINVTLQVRDVLTIKTC